MTDPIEMHIKHIKASTSIHLQDGNGAVDALYELAVKHGAPAHTAAGFAHSACGAISELQGCVYSMAELVKIKESK